MLTVGFQIKEAIKVHQGGNKKTLMPARIDLLELVGIPVPVSGRYPLSFRRHEPARGMTLWRLPVDQKLLIADELTNAGRTIQAQIIELLLELQQKENMALVLITSTWRWWRKRTATKSS